MDELLDEALQKLTASAKGKALLVKAERSSLTGADMKHLVGPEARIIQYPDLARYSSVLDILDPLGRAVVFFVEEKQGVVEQLPSRACHACWPVTLCSPRYTPPARSAHATARALSARCPCRCPGSWSRNTRTGWAVTWVSG